MVLNSQNVIMSCAWGLRLIGKSLLCVGSSTSLVDICGVMEEVNHVLSTSFSGTIFFDLHFGHDTTGGLSFVGSTGNDFSSASMTSSQSAQYHTGKATPKYL